MQNLITYKNNEVRIGNLYIITGNTPSTQELTGTVTLPYNFTQILLATTEDYENIDSPQTGNTSIFQCTARNNILRWYTNPGFKPGTSNIMKWTVIGIV